MGGIRGAVLAGLIALGVAEVRAAAPPPSYAALDTVLRRHRQADLVDYGALAREPGPLRRFLAEAAEADPEQWPREAQIAFWVNVYNARVLDGVIRRPGLASVLDVGRLLGIPTLGFFRERARSAGRSLSLDDIEHGILRRRFGDARLHFVLNCASASCPVLPERALTAATLDSVLDAATAAFLADGTRNRLGDGRALELSEIFKWYRSDFVTAAGSVQAFVARHTRIPIAPGAPIRHLRYDWALNGRW